MNPRIIRKGPLTIAGASGDGCRTGEVWQAFMALAERAPLSNKRSDDGYEVRVYLGERCDVHVGVAVEGKAAPEHYAVMELPASHYASFDVYVAKGYDSENRAMDGWLLDHAGEWSQRLLDGHPYAVEFYDERFHGEEADSLVEIWVPLQKAAPARSVEAP